MGDLIERDLTIHELEAFKESRSANLLRMSFDDVIDVIRAVKSEEKNEREGMWILYGSDFTQEFRCSKCRKIIKIPGPLYYSECPYKYCPNCGKRNLNPHEKPEGVKDE